MFIKSRNTNQILPFNFFLQILQINDVSAVVDSLPLDLWYQYAVMKTSQIKMIVSQNEFNISVIEFELHHSRYIWTYLDLIQQSSCFEWFSSSTFLCFVFFFLFFFFFFLSVDKFSFPAESSNFGSALFRFSGIKISILVLLGGIKFLSDGVMTKMSPGSVSVFPFSSLTLINTWNICIYYITLMACSS